MSRPMILCKKNFYCVLLLTLVFFSVSSGKAGLQEDIEFLSSDRFKGRKTGSSENRDVQNWLIERLKKLQVRPAGDKDKVSFQNAFTNSYDFLSKKPIEGSNILGIIYPQNKWTEESPQVLLGAHFDHIDTCFEKFGNKDKICNGATDNAAAVAVLLSVIGKLAQQISAPVAIAFWDAEEMGLLGSDAFLKNPTFDLSKLKLYINLDIIGSNLFKGLENHHVILGIETGGIALKDTVNRATLKESEKVKYHQLSYAFGHGRSDMTSFFRHDQKIPFLFFSDADGAVYHSNSDKAKHVNLAKVESIERVVMDLTSTMTSKNPPVLTYMKPQVLADKGSFLGSLLRLILGQNHKLKVGVPFPEASDLQTVKMLYEKLLAHKNENKLSEETVSQLQNMLDQLKAVDSKNGESLTIQEGYLILKAGSYFTFVAKNLSFIP